MKTKSKAVKNMGLVPAKSKKKEVVIATKPVNKKEVAVKIDGRKTRVTMSSQAREHIRNGGTKETLYAFLQKECGLIPEKKWYVNWYFSEARRKGFIPAKTK